MAGEKEESIEYLSDGGAIVAFNDKDANASEVRGFDDEARQKLQDLADSNARKASELEQQLNDVVRFAQGTISENKRLAGLIQNGEKMLVGQAGGRVKAELAAAESAFKKAYEDGDTEAMLKSQKEISRLTHEEQQVRSYVPVDVTPQQVAQNIPAQKPAAPEPDPKSKEWIDRNADWWMKDRPMTGFALGIHEDLVRAGVRPGTDDYVKGLDERMAQAFPSKFQSNSGNAPRNRIVGTSAVAPATRTASGKTTQKVQISESMTQTARRLGVPVQAYAEELARLNQNG